MLDNCEQGRRRAAYELESAMEHLCDAKPGAWFAAVQSINLAFWLMGAEG
jgi:hypothetical protein